MRDNPIQAAVDQLRIAAEAVQRAKLFMDYQGKTPDYNALCTVYASLIEHQRTLQLIEQ